jgi:hypothetical protein
MCAGLRLAIFVLGSIFSISCCTPSIKQPPTYTASPQTDTIAGRPFHIKDTTSTLYITHHECTECLDAYVDSGTLYIPPALHEKLKQVERTKGASFVPNSKDLYLTDPEKINELLFGDSVTYGERLNNTYYITGKAIDIKGLGIVFRVDTYKKLNR